MNYRPKQQFNKKLFLLIPEYKEVKGSPKKVFPPFEQGKPFFSSFKSYGGTDVVSNGILTVENTAVIETWYRPDITSECQISTTEGAIYEILGEPENIEERNQFLRIKIRRIKGKA